MKSKEAYHIILQMWQGNKVGDKYPNFDDVNEALYIIKQDLDRLEKLEIENDELKRINGAYQESNIVFQDLIKKFKKAIEIILKYKINPSTFIFTRKIYKESCGKDLTFEKAYSLLEFDGTQEEFNLLKEVLENDK